MARTTIEQQIENLEAEQRKIKDELRAKRSKLAKENRKRRNHALMVAGGLVVSCFDDGWESIDWTRLAALLKENKKAFKTCTAEVLPSDKAAKRLRAWEKSTRAREGADDDVKKVKGQGAGQGV